LGAAIFGSVPSSALRAAEVPRPNVLWLTVEDISPYLGVYGHPNAQTPRLDRLAKDGIRYTQAYANAPVCAVARSALLTGMHSPAIGTHQMRSRPQLPANIPAYPKLFRQAGYYCTNNVKTDYNSSYEGDRTLWDASSRNAHYRNRADGQPFFAVFNNTQSHESQLDRLPADLKTRVDPAEIGLPPFHPDLPEMRLAWARLHELITRIDTWVGQMLQELEAEGEAENTIVIFHSDHGGMLAGTKRYLNMPGTRVPMIVRFPTKWQHLAPHPPGSVESRVVSFVDLPKTLLSLVGIEPPALMQGCIFLGPHAEPAPAVTPLYRDRMSERYDFCRGVVDGRHFFVRNFMPHRPPGRCSVYGYDVQANWRAWREHFEAGKTDAIQSRFFQPKPVLELYAVHDDPWNVKNLADAPEYRRRCEELEAALDEWMIEVRDIGLIPEPLFYELVGPDKAFATLYEYAQSQAYPVERVLAAAKSASLGDPAKKLEYLSHLQDQHPAIRHWGAYGLFLLRDNEVSIRDVLGTMVAGDDFAGNRLIAAQALAVSGDPDTAFRAIYREAQATNDAYVFLFALNAFQYSHTDDRLTREDWEQFQKKETSLPYALAAGLAQRIVTYALENWPERAVVD
jgi:arylsulfatase A-like enzyme